MRFVLLILLLLSSNAAMAAEIRVNSVKYDERVINIKLDAVVNAGKDRVFAVMTDYGHLNKLDPTILQSSADNNILNMDTEDCVMFVCRKMHLVQNIDISRDHSHLTFTIIPEESDMEYGVTKWVLREENGQTHLELDASLKMKEDMPPMIGQAMIEDMIYNKNEQSIKNIEVFAR